MPSSARQVEAPAGSPALSGYGSPAYAAALAEFGPVRPLPASGGALLLRAIPGFDLCDAAGCYPLMVCARWNRLAAELASLAGELVAVSAVVDPLANVEPAVLAAAFPDRCAVYKQHYVVDLSRPLDSIPSAHHRRNIRKALNQVDVRPAPPTAELLTDWQRLYDGLAARHGITGIARFSPRSFAGQFAAPGLRAFAAYGSRGLCGVTLWYRAGDAAYYHLAAYDEQGYAAGASYALFWTALGQFAAEGVRIAALGSGAGVAARDSGLTRFKQGWATGTRPAYFCGRILQPEAYARLTADRPPTDFFPAYRSPAAPS